MRGGDAPRTAEIRPVVKMKSKRPTRPVRIHEAKFSTSDVADLTRLGLVPAQVDELRQRLPYLAFTFFPKPAIGPIRKRLAQSDALMRAACIDLAELIGADEAGPAMNVREMVRERDPFVLDRAREALEVLRAAYAKVRKGMPRQQRQRANMMRISRIKAALVQGFVRHHDPKRLGKALPPYELKVSRSPPFAEIASICYIAADSDADPDSDIRAWLEWDAAGTRASRARFGLFEIETRPNRGRPRKIR